MLPVLVTQTQEENDNPTMALPVWETILVPQIPKSSFRVNFHSQRQRMQHLSLNLISSKFLTTFVDPPKLRDTRSTLLLPNPMATRKKTRQSTPKRRLDKQNMEHFQECQKTMSTRGIMTIHSVCTWNRCLNLAGVVKNNSLKLHC